MKSEGVVHPASGGARAEPRSILVVDDNELVRNTLVELLSDTGYRAVAVPDGGRALREMLSRRPRRLNAAPCVAVGVRTPSLPRRIGSRVEGWPTARALPPAADARGASG